MCGLDPEGGIPTYPVDITVNTTTSAHQYYCDPTGVVDCRAKLNAALAACTIDHAVYMPAGLYKVSGGNITIPNRRVLRGAGGGYPWLPTEDASRTILSMVGRFVSFDGGGKSAWRPGASLGTNIPAGYVKDSTSITLSSVTDYEIGDYISIFQNKSDEISVVGDSGTATWLGEGNDASESHDKQQYSKITNKVGSVLTISPGIFYVPTNGATADPEVREQTFSVTMSGIEDLKLKGNGTNDHLIYMYGVRHCWAKDIETYNTGGATNQNHIQISYSMNCEVRNSLVHHGAAYASGANYGIHMYWWNSGHKIENNIVTDVRHGIVHEGGGSGNAILYNYLFNCYDSDNPASLTSDLLANHGAFPHMNLIEGNVCGNLTADHTWGTSAYQTLFRNYSKGYRSSPSFSELPIAFWAGRDQVYFNLIGNVAGRSAWTSGRAMFNGPGSYPDSGTSNIAFCYGMTDNWTWGDNDTYANLLTQGNYNYITDGVAKKDGTAGWDDADHELPASLYYSSKPSWFEGVEWPPIGPDVTGQVVQIPAEYRYLNQTLPAGGSDYTYSIVGKVDVKGTSAKTFTRIYLKTSSGQIYIVGSTTVTRLGVITVTWGDEDRPLYGWDRWKKQGGSSALYDTISGKLRVRSGDVFYSDVIDLTRYDLTKLGIDITTVLGSGVVEWRGQGTLFAWDAVTPSWEVYTRPVFNNWQFVQIKIKL
jgi:hypothetical protein